jgi:UDP-N-acetylglucosamine 2-epimerase (non-hydrolysing)
VTQGTSTLIGADAAKLRACLRQVMEGRYKQGRCPELWDGKAANRIAAVVLSTG